MDKILSWLKGGVFKEVGKVIDDLHTSGEEKSEAKRKILEVFTNQFLALIAMKSDIIKTEASGNFLQRSWRPILMLMFGFVVVYSKFIAPAFELPNTVLEPEFWTLLQYGIGGYVGGRTLEKLADKGALNLDFRRKRKEEK